jgi:hypothetical protein
MNDAILTIILFASFLLAMGGARLFRTLDMRFWPVAGPSLISGAVVGAVLAFVPMPVRFAPIVTGILLTLATLYVRLNGEESEPSEGMALGAVTGAASAIVPLLVAGEGLRVFSSNILAGAVAGLGVTIASNSVSMPLRQIVIDLLTAAGASLAALAPHYGETLLGLQPDTTAIAVATAIPLILILTSFVQWPAVKRELDEEASLGVIDWSDARSSAHPLRRFFRAGWNDPAARREFVRLATKVALRKRQQRSRSGELARIYQLEIIRLRMQMQEMKQLDIASANARASRDGDLPSDTIAR